MDVLERFLSYVKINTKSDELSPSRPSTQCQLDLSNLLAEQMKALGAQDVYIDDCGNAIGTLPATEGCSAPVLGLVTHVDTSSAASGENVKPRIVRYEGQDIELSEGMVLSAKQFPYLADCEGLDLIVTDGTTLLGADDKAGVAEVMALVDRLQASGRKHGELRLIFTTDEETGNGVDGLVIEKLACDYAYTVDGGPVGQLEYENFNAASAWVDVHGLSIHPGSAKDQMINAATVAMELHAMLPADEVPEKTEGYEGFFHLTDMKGDVSNAQLTYIIRDHDREKFEIKKQQLADAAAAINDKYGKGTATATIKDSYYNMREKLEPHMHLIDRARAAFAKNGIEAVATPIRGGTDGARLSYMGLPCPNLSTGGYNFHGEYEFIPVQSLYKMVDVLEELICSFAE